MVNKPFANCLPFPAAVLDQHAVLLGKTGSGKSSKLRVMVEWLLSKGKRVCIVDPKGDWWGIKASADGRGPGFPVVLFGDFKDTRAQDVPINDRSGKQIAELVATGNRPCVIGMRGWSQGAMARFWIDFAESLFAKNNGELYLVGDEFHNFAPKQWKGQSDKETPAGVALHWSNRILSEGRGLGIVALLASQRPQKVHNDTLTSCETLVALRVVHKADRDAIKAWIDGNGDPAVGNEVLSSLAAMPREQSWVWSPEVGFGPERVTFPMFTTFDSFAPPQLQKKVSMASWSDVDLNEVKAELASVIKEATANDPKTLKAEIANLQRQLAAKPAAVPPPSPVEPKRVDVPVMTASAENRLASLEKTASDLVAKFDATVSGLADKLAVRLDQLRDGVKAVRDEVDRRTEAPPAIARPAALPPGQMLAKLPARRFTPSVVGTLDAGQLAQVKRPARAVDGIDSSMQKILDALAWWEAIGQMTPDRAAVAVIAGYTPGQGRFNNLCGSLRSAGLVAYPAGGAMALTEMGRAAANPPPRPGSLADVHAAWQQKLDASQWKLVDVVISAYPNAVDKDELAAAAGYTPGQGRFNNLLGSIRSLGVVTKRSPVEATPLLFPPNLRS